MGYPGELYKLPLLVTVRLVSLWSFAVAVGGQRKLAASGVLLHMSNYIYSILVLEYYILITMASYGGHGGKA